MKSKHRHLITEESKKRAKKLAEDILANKIPSPLLAITPPKITIEKLQK